MLVLVLCTVYGYQIFEENLTVVEDEIALYITSPPVFQSPHTTEKSPLLGHLCAMHWCCKKAPPSQFHFSGQASISSSYYIIDGIKICLCRADQFAYTKRIYQTDRYIDNPKMIGHPEITQNTPDNVHENDVITNIHSYILIHTALWPLHIFSPIPHPDRQKININATKQKTFPPSKTDQNPTMYNHYYQTHAASYIS